MNTVNLTGRLTKDPEVRYTQADSPMAIARFSLAVEREIKKDGQPTADFISCVAFSKTAERVEFEESKNSSEAQGNSIPDSEMVNIPDGIDEDVPFI